MNSSFSKSISLLRDVLLLASKHRRGLRHVLGTALAQSREVKNPEIDVTAIPSISIEQLVGRACTVHIGLFPPTESSVTSLEACAIAVLMHISGARRVFEFGTYRGVSTTQLVLNAPEGATLLTLDLPSEGVTTQFAVTDYHETKLHKLAQKGDLIPAELRTKITFLAQDSALFDPAPYAGTMDFVFVDGAHTAEYVRNDSEKAWTMLRSGGIVAWHDCRPASPDVARFLLRSPYDVRRIDGTTVAFARKP